MVMTYPAAGTCPAALQGGDGGVLFAFDAAEKMNTDALRAQRDDALMEDFIRRNKRFILGCAYRTLHRFLSDSDDEWSIALIAFHEAVRSYDESRGNFKAFAALVIKRRLLDYIESQARRKNEVSTDFGEASTDEDTAAGPLRLEVQRAVARKSVEAAAEQTDVRDEIEAMQQILGGYGFSFFDLTDCSPKAQKTKASCARAIRALLADGALLAQLRRTGSLPSKALCAAAGVPKKILENHRKYIIAAAEILDGDYPQLAEYLRFVRKEANGE